MANPSDLFPAQRKTKLPGGYMGKILRVDLTTGSMRDENLPEEPLLRKYIGGQALAEYILLKELPLDAKPYGVENKVVMMTGPLTGTGFTPGGTKVTAVFLSPMTKNSLGRGASSGHWAAYLKSAGYDGVIIEGAALKPTYLYIKDRSPSCATRPLLGKGARDTEDLLRATLDHERKSRYRPGGEHLSTRRCCATITTTPPRTAAARSSARRSSKGSWFTAPSGLRCTTGRR
jgi:aldehyde:ferredoxin oxidoreductase